MAKDSAENFVSNIAAAIAGGGLVAGLGFLTPALVAAVGSALAGGVWLLVISGATAFFLGFKYYTDVLASATKAKGSRSRQAYENLHANLSKGGYPALLYAHRLSQFLGQVDRFFGDDGLKNRSLFPHAFGLKTLAPLWTAASFDRSLLLALIYPICSVFFDLGALRTRRAG